MARIVLTGGNGILGQTGKQVRDAINAMTAELYAWLHQRKHGLASASDHDTDLANKGKFAKLNASTGAPELAFIADGDIPDTIARTVDLTNHISDTDNPHQVTAEQLGITVITYAGGEGIDITGSTISVKLAAGGNLEFDVNGALKTTGLGLSRYQACSTTGKEVWVTATGVGVTGAWANGNDLTITIPTGVVLSSISIYLSTYSSMTVTFSGDLTSPGAHKWFPLMQAWREDTQVQLTGVVLQGNSDNDFKFNITGLINTTSNFIRLAV